MEMNTIWPIREKLEKIRKHDEEIKAAIEGKSSDELIKQMFAMVWKMHSRMYENGLILDVRWNTAFRKWAMGGIGVVVLWGMYHLLGRIIGQL